MEELEILGLIGVELSVGEINSHAVVTKSGSCLLGHVVSKELGLLRISLNTSSFVVRLREERRQIAEDTRHSTHYFILVGTGH